MKRANPEPYSSETRDMILLADAVISDMIDCTPNDLNNGNEAVVLGVFNVVAMQHLISIVTLAKTQVVPATVAALMRPLLESVVRGLWLFTRQSPELLARFLQDPGFFRNHSFKKLADEVGQSMDLPEYFAPFTEAYPGMCDYTHTGLRQFSRHFHPDQRVGPLQDDYWTRNLVLEALKATLLFLILSSFLRGEKDSEEKLKRIQDRLP